MGLLLAVSTLIDFLNAWKTFHECNTGACRVKEGALKERREHAPRRRFNPISAAKNLISRHYANFSQNVAPRELSANKQPFDIRPMTSLNPLLHDFIIHNFSALIVSTVYNWLRTSNQGGGFCKFSKTFALISSPLLQFKQVEIRLPIGWDYFAKNVA